MPNCSLLTSNFYSVKLRYLNESLNFYCSIWIRLVTFWVNWKFSGLIQNCWMSKHWTPLLFKLLCSRRFVFLFNSWNECQFWNILAVGFAKKGNCFSFYYTVWDSHRYRYICTCKDGNSIFGCTLSTKRQKCTLLLFSPYILS